MKPTESDLKWQVAQLQTELDELRSAAEALYVAAHWTPDRPCNASVLWTRLRIAAGWDAAEEHIKKPQAAR